MPLHAAIEQVVAILPHVHAPRLHASLNLRGLEIRDPHETGLALRNDLFHGPHGLFKGDARIGPVDQVDTDIVGLEEGKAVFDGQFGARSPRVPRPLVFRKVVVVENPPLGDEYDLLPPFAQSLGISKELGVGWEWCKFGGRSCR